MRIGSLFGIDIRIDPSWIVLFFLILWTFSFSVLPRTVPELGTATYVAMGVVGTLLFFASLLAHELSHSLVARAKGIPVPAITLFIFGGMSHTSREAESAGDEFAIAIVGPVSSAVIAALFAAIWWAGDQGGWGGAITGTARYLAWINAALAVFNMLPGFPLDGGRVFRSAVWKLTGDVSKATRVAATTGKWMGYLLMGLGILQVVAGGAIGGIWLIFIGWFLSRAASATYEQHRRRHETAGAEGRRADAGA